MSEFTTVDFILNSRFVTNYLQHHQCTKASDLIQPSDEKRFSNFKFSSSSNRISTKLIITHKLTKYTIISREMWIYICACKRSLLNCSSIILLPLLFFAVNWYLQHPTRYIEFHIFLPDISVNYALANCRMRWYFKLTWLFNFCLHGRCFGRPSNGYFWWTFIDNLSTFYDQLLHPFPPQEDQSLGRNCCTRGFSRN